MSDRPKHHRDIEVIMHHDGQLVMKSRFTDMRHDSTEDIREVLIDLINNVKTLEVGDTFSITEVE